jgi:hypothetical protein
MQCNTTDSETRRLLLRGMLLPYVDTLLEFPLDYIPFIYLPISFLLTIESIWSSSTTNCFRKPNCVINCFYVQNQRVNTSGII